MAEEKKSIEEELSYPILICDKILKSAKESESFKLECSEVSKRVDCLAQMLRTTVILSTSNPSLYDRPIHRILSESVKNLDRALTLVRKCKRAGLLRRVVTITTAADFRKLFSLLDSSLGDFRWLLGVFNSQATGDFDLALPPIANTDPMLAWVWTYLAILHMGSLQNRTEAANSLSSLALDSERNKQIIITEGGVPPLLKLLKESSSSEAQIAAATVLAHLAGDPESVRNLSGQMAVPIAVQVLGESPIGVQISVAFLIARMVGQDVDSQEEFGRENAIRKLVSILCFETLDSKDSFDKPTSIHSLVQIKKEMPVPARSSNSMHSEGSSRGRDRRKERENESPEEKFKLMINCSEALWVLARGSVSNSRRICETKGLLCLAKIIEKEKGDLQFNCMMTLMEIATAAESNADLRRVSFKTNSPAAKAVVDQLIRIVIEGRSPTLQIPAIKSVGSLARTFPARETRIIRPLVNQLSHKNPDIAEEAAVALGKFANPENFLCVEHSKAIIEFDGVLPLTRLLRSTERTQLHGLILLCYLALNVGSSEALEKSRALTALELAGRSMAAQHPSLRELLPKAIYSLELYQAGVHPQRLDVEYIKGTLDKHGKDTRS
ncbi:armadillo repeat only 4 isoform X2 [Tasmannia lanceolata]|uniref:armadillo repeat only 4 isoform X2 n=1 Tax=Tasmannia lanceolata TaxID=3420 RepID=UPI004062D20A